VITFTRFFMIGTDLRKHVRARIGQRLPRLLPENSHTMEAFHTSRHARISALRLNIHPPTRRGGDSSERTPATSQQAKCFQLGQLNIFRLR
jgi:hypothetical protein